MRPSSILFNRNTSKVAQLSITLEITVEKFLKCLKNGSDRLRKAEIPTAKKCTKELDNRVKLLNLDCKVIALLPLTLL